MYKKITRTFIDLELVRKIYAIKQSGKNYGVAAVETGVSPVSAQRIYNLFDAVESGEDLNDIYPGNYFNLKSYVQMVASVKPEESKPDNTAQCFIAIMQQLEQINEKLSIMCRAWGTEQ